MEKAFEAKLAAMKASMEANFNARLSELEKEHQENLTKNSVNLQKI